MPFRHRVRRPVRGRSKRPVPHRSLSRPLLVESLESRCLLASISGNLYDDVNADGVKDIDEPSLQGWRVYLDEKGKRSYDAQQT